MATAEQQRAAGRQKRATLQRQLAQQCRLLVAPGAWEQVTALCGAAVSGTSSAQLQEWLPAAARVGLQVVQQQTPVLDDQAVQGDACSCLSSLLCHFGCDSSSTEALVAQVRAQLAAGISLRAVLAAAAASSGAGEGVAAE